MDFLLKLEFFKLLFEREREREREDFKEALCSAQNPTQGYIP